MKTVQKAQENFEQAQQEVVQAEIDLDKFMLEAPLTIVLPVQQVTVSLVKTLGGLTGIIDPDAGQPPDHLIHAIQESRAIRQTSPGWCSFRCRAGCRAGSRILEPGRLRNRADGGLRRGARLRRADAGDDQSTHSRGGAHTVDTAVEEDANQGVTGCGARESPVSTSNAESQRH